MAEITDIRLPEICFQVYEEIKSLPFYKAQKGYQFAAYLLNDRETTTSDFLHPDPEKEPHYWGCKESVTEGLRNLFLILIEDLSAITVSDEDLTAWMTFKKSQGGVEEYQRLLRTVLEQIILFELQEEILPKKDATSPLIQEMTQQEREELSPNTAGYAYLRYQGSYHKTYDMAEIWQKTETGETAYEDVVLNHRNPFADISIKEQQFIYGSVMGQFEMLGLTTSHTLTQVAKDTDHSYLALQPGFKIHRSRKLSDMGKSQPVVFDNTLTTEITESDDNIYVYIE